MPGSQASSDALALLHASVERIAVLLVAWYTADTASALPTPFSSQREKGLAAFLCIYAFYILLYTGINHI